ncbi:MAG TPA: adenylate/guanylate cyclase domain-containing protein [Candidatus Cybelea sp.]|nr:adenylate/guanylate cyclase domain-containing protein [Candidatus Cybelea sp.]
MADERVERRLAAILAADVAGYSRLMGTDEEGTLAALTAHRVELIEPCIAAHQGRIVKTTGDGLLAEFASVVNAVRCAIAFQKGMGERNSGVATDRRLEFRIGVNLGDIIVQEQDVFGDGVNISSRLEALSAPGHACISGVVYESVQGKLDLVVEDAGEVAVKNIKKPIHVYRVVCGGSPTPAVAAADVASKPAIAVLPFDNMSGDPEQEYFSDGLTEDIITLLAAWRSFPVIARNSSFSFKHQSRDIRQVARELSARYVLEGSVRKSANHIRVTAQLIDAELGHHIWAKKFDGALGDIFALQDEITTQIVSSVEPEMEKAELKKMETKRPASMSAWDFYLRGREHFHGLTPADMAKARAMFERAVELDPNYSDAYAGLSLTFQREMLFEIAGDRAAWESKALALARRAVALDNESSNAHYALSGALIWSNQHADSIAETRIAAQLNPSNIVAWLALGNRLNIVGETAEGIPLLERTLQRNPRDPHNHIYYGQLGRAYINERDYDKALSVLREAARLKPDYPHTYHLLAICLGHLGRIEEAREAAGRCEQLHPGFIAKRARWNINLDPEANRHLTEGLQKAGLVA